MSIPFCAAPGLIICLNLRGFTVNILAGYPAPVGVNRGAPTMGNTALQGALIPCPVREDVGAFPRRFSFFKSSHKFTTIGKEQFALTMRFVVLPCTGVRTSARPDLGTLPLPDIIQPFSRI